MSKQYIAKDADIIGDVQMGEDVNVWYHATIRADAAKIMIGNRSNIPVSYTHLDVYKRQVLVWVQKQS